MSECASSSKSINIKAYHLNVTLFAISMICLCQSMYCFKVNRIQKGRDLLACYQLVPTSADDWFNKGSQSMCNHVYVIMHVKDL